MRLRYKGSITFPVVLICMSYIGFAVLIINFTRIHSANSRLAVVADFVSDSVLSKYDSYLYDEYSLMGVKENSNLSNEVKEMVSECLSYKNSNFDFYGFKDAEAQIQPVSDFSDIKSFKTAILNAHRNKFLVEGAERAIRLLKFWKTFMDGKSISELHAKAMETMGKLQKKYDDCRVISKEIVKIYNEIKQEGNGVSSYDLIILVSEYQSIQNSQEESDIERKKEIALVLKNIRLFHSKLKNLKLKLEDFKSSCEVALLKFEDVVDTLLKKKEEISDDDFKENIDSIVNDIHSYKEAMIYAISNSQDIIKILGEALEKFSNLNNDIQKIKSGESFEHEEFNFEDIVNLINLNIEIFEAKSEDKMDVITVFTFMWKSLKGGFLPDYSRFDLEIERDLYDKLPSAHLKGHENIEIQTSSGFGGSYSEMCEEGIDNYSNLSDFDDKAYLKLNDKNEFEHMIDRFTIIDFTLEHFTYNIYEKKGKKISEISKNPLYQSEIEYLLHGKNSSKTNMILTDMQIWAMRNIVNAISLSLYKKTELHSISSILSSFTLEVGYPVIYGVCLFGWSSIESMADLRELHKGNSIPIFKGKRDFLIDLTPENIERMIKEIKKEGLEASYQTVEKKKTENLSIQDKKSINFDYRDYLFILMCFSEEDTLLYRIQDIIQIRGLLREKEFDIRSYEVMYELRINAKLPLIYSDIIHADLFTKTVGGF